MIAAMPGRSRNADRQAIEAFARIHQGKAGSANGSRLFSGHPPATPRHTNGIPEGDYVQSTEGGSVLEPLPGVQSGAHDLLTGPTLMPGGEMDATSFGYLPPLPNLERPRIGRRVAVASTATVVVILIALGIAGAASGPRHNHVSTSSRTSSAAGTSGISAVSTHRSSKSGGRGDSTRPRESTTTQATTGPLSPTSTSAGSVQFLMPAGSGPYSVTIAAAGGSCWTEASASSGSSVSWAGTVAEGSRQVLAPGPSWWLRLGAPEYATVTVNGRLLRLPATSAPLDVDIVTS